MEERKELVKYRNDMNEIQLQDFAAMDMNCFFLVCSIVSERQSDEVEITFADIRKAIGYTSKNKDRLIELLRRMNRKLIQCAGHYENDDEIVDFNLFYLFRISKTANTLTVAVNPQFAYLLNNVAKEFTVFELKEFVSLKHRNSKILYRLLKQWRTQGYTRMYTMEEIREMMGVPERYENKYVTRNIIRPAIQEIKDNEIFAGLTCETVRDDNAVGHPTKGYIFRFRAEKPHKKAVEDKDGTETGTTQRKRGHKRKNDFTAIESNNYDFDDLESKLLGEDSK